MFLLHSCFCGSVTPGGSPCEIVCDCGVKNCDDVPQVEMLFLELLGCVPQTVSLTEDDVTPAVQALVPFSDNLLL